jgi:cytochrome c553
MRRWLTALAAALAVPVFLGAVLLLLGLVPIAASSGHWPPVAWFLNFVKRRAVSTQATQAQLPPLDAAWLLAKGAGHFESGCRPCHGSPEQRPPRIPQGMLPAPPDLSARVLEWQPEELFYIVQHGIKFTGMPAWPAAVRTDEVAAVVAFLRVLPGLDAAGYVRLARGAAQPASAGEALAGPGEGTMPAVVLSSCASCHGRDGLGRGSPAFPRLAGQPSAYLLAALDAYASGARPSGIMMPVVLGLDAERRAALASYYAQLPPPAASVALAPPEATARGQLIAERGLPERRVPSCNDCHGAGEADERYPSLAGQWPEYLVLQLELFEAKTRGGSDHAQLMDPVRGLTASERSDVAAFYAAAKTAR